MNILLACHAPWRNTGYGAPARQIVEMFNGLGHAVVIMVIDGAGDAGAMKWEGITVIFPPDRWGESIVSQLCHYYKIDTVVSFFDPWVFAGYDVSVPWYPWFPVDQYPIPFGLEISLERAKKSFVYSEWGVNTLQAAMPDLDVCRMPIPISQKYFDAAGVPKKTAKEALSLPLDVRIVGMSGSNIGGDRKSLNEAIAGFSLYADGKDDMLLMNVRAIQAYNLPYIAETLGAKNISFVDSFTKDYVLGTPARQALLYRAMDVLLHPSAAEGFGLCLVEAMATGTSVIGAENTSMPEVIGKGGILVNDTIGVVSPQGGTWSRPTPIGIAKALDADLSGCDPITSAERFTVEKCQAMWEEHLGNSKEI